MLLGNKALQDVWQKVGHVGRHSDRILRRGQDVLELKLRTTGADSGGATPVQSVTAHSACHSSSLHIQASRMLMRQFTLALAAMGTRAAGQACTATQHARAGQMPFLPSMQSAPSKLLGTVLKIRACALTSLRQRHTPAPTRSYRGTQSTQTCTLAINRTETRASSSRSLAYPNKVIDQNRDAAGHRSLLEAHPKARPCGCQAEEGGVSVGQHVAPWEQPLAGVQQLEACASLSGPCRMM